MKANIHFRKCEERFGKVDKSKDIIARFGKRYTNGIRGWQFSEAAIREYNAKGKLLTMDLDLPSGCWLDCVYCFAKEDAYYRPQKGDRPLKLEEIKETLLRAKQLGLQSAKIIGFGEPFANPKILDFLDFATENEITLCIFTAAYTLKENKFGGSLEKAVEFLHQHDVSLMVKFHTLDEAKEDSIVRREGYTKKRDRVLRALLEHGGFTSGPFTRLGMENVIASQDIGELVEIYRYFKIFRNLYVDIDPPIPVGRTTTPEQSESIGLQYSKILELAGKIYQMNKKYGVPTPGGVSQFLGGAPCSQLPNGIYVTLSGKVMTCCGGNEELGNLRETPSLEELFLKNPYRLNPEYGIYHQCPYREKSGLLPKGWEREVET